MELNLDLSLIYVPKTVSDFLREVSKSRNFSQKISKLDDYIKRLEEETRKIDAFKRELPLCMLLLNDAIDRLKEEAIQCTELNDRSVTEEFIPLMGNCDENGGVKMGDDCSDKKDWMSSVQLWSTDINHDYEKQDSVSELTLRSEENDRSVSENPVQPFNHRNRGGAFVPFKEQSGFPSTAVKQDKEVSGLSLMNPISELGSCNSISKSNGSGRADSDPTLPRDQNQMKLQRKPQHQQQQNQNLRKQRRSWSPELHRRFIEALQQLGGSEAATPKQIRELMQVDGLTNDEVKSHLQKYRLHIRKLPASSVGQANGLWLAQNRCVEQSKPSVSQSGSPQGPILASGSANGISSTGDHSMEEEEDEKSDGRSWKGGVHAAGAIDV